MPSDCETGKIRYASVRAARFTMRFNGNSLWVYRCPKCKGLHVTKERKKGNF